VSRRRSASTSSVDRPFGIHGARGRVVRAGMILGLLLVTIPVCRRDVLNAHDRLTPGAGEIVISPGLIEGDFLVSATVRKALSGCLDLGGSLMAIPSSHSRSELFFTSELRYGLWYCCIPDYYIDYLYFTVGAGSFSRMGLAERENDFALSYGSGLRFNISGRFIINAEVKAFAVFPEGGRRDRLAFTLGGGFPL